MRVVEREGEEMEGGGGGRLGFAAIPHTSSSGLSVGCSCIVQMFSLETIILSYGTESP